MKITRYEEAKHFDIIQKWSIERGVSIDKQLLSTNGYFIKGYCAAFLYETNSKMALIENVISNPLSDFDSRNEALDLMLNKMLKDSNELGFKMVVGFSNNQKLLERVIRLGFKPTSEFLLVFKDLGDK